MKIFPRKGWLNTSRVDDYVMGRDARPPHEDWITDWMAKTMWEELETTQPSTRIASARFTSVSEADTSAASMLNEVFWEVSGGLGIELGHAAPATSSRPALTDGQLALEDRGILALRDSAGGSARRRSRSPSHTRRPQKRRRQESQDSRSRSPVRNTRRQDPRPRSPDRSHTLNSIRQKMMDEFSEQAEEFRHPSQQYQRLDVRDITASDEACEDKRQVERNIDRAYQGLRDGTLQLYRLRPVVVIRFVQQVEYVAVFGNTELKAVQRYQRWKGGEVKVQCAVFEDADYFGEEVPAPLACRLAKQMKDPIACLRRFLENKRHAQYDPAESPHAVQKYKRNMQSLDVRHVRHSHNFVNMLFAHGPHKGQSVQTLVEDLKARKCKPPQITPLVVIKFGKQEYWAVFGNRRLKALLLGEEKISAV